MASSSLNTLLKSLTRVGRSESVYNVANADRINAIQDAIRLLVRGENIIAGSNVLKRSSDGYVVLTGMAGGGRRGGAVSDVMSFDVIDATVTGGEEGPGVHLAVKVIDGKVNGEYPDGMGFDSYFLDLVEETYQQVYLYITFDADSEVITSRSLGISDFPPTSGISGSIGTLIIPLADIIISYTGGFDSVPYVSLITQINNGDINFRLIYSLHRSQPTLLPVHAFADFLPAVGRGAAFDVFDATTTVFPSGPVNLKVKVIDGKVNGEYPSGMGFNNYVISLDEESYQQVYLYITYDETTLDITSRTLDVSDSPPDPVSGTLIIPLADITISYTAISLPDHPTSLPYVSVINQLEDGNINFTLIYGLQDGVPALLAIKSYGDWIPLPEPS
jgi:hypothetical protein